MARPGGPKAKLSDVARTRFKDALFSGRIKIGSFVSQADLIATLDVPMGALREAMQVLESEGLLTIVPRTGIQIIQPDLELMRNAFQLRRIIELEAVRKFAQSASPDEVALMERDHRAMIAAAEASPGAEGVAAHAIDVDWRFHNKLVGQLRNPLISLSYGRTLELLNVIRMDNRYALPVYSLVPSMQEHLGIIAAIRSRDAPLAVQAMDAHLTSAMHRAMGL